jgi:hypothetical protein
LIHGIPLAPPRVTGTDNFLVEVASIRQEDIDDHPAVAVATPDTYYHRLPEYEARRELLGALAEGLSLFWGVDPMQTQGLVARVAEDRDRVTVGDADHHRTEVLGMSGEGKTQREK